MPQTSEDVAPALLEGIRRDFAANLGGRQRAAQLLEKIRAGSATYADAGDYAEEVGMALADAFRANLSGATLPDGRMYWNIAERVVQPMLAEDHALVAEAAQTVQQSLNEAAGLGLRAQDVPLDADRVDGILQKICGADQYDSVSWVLDEPVKNFSRHVVDESLRRNVNFQGRAGLRPRVIRRAEAHCCRWCSSLAGTYAYPHGGIRPRHRPPAGCLDEGMDRIRRFCYNGSKKNGGAAGGYPPVPERGTAAIPLCQAPGRIRHDLDPGIPAPGKRAGRCRGIRGCGDAAAQ